MYIHFPASKKHGKTTLKTLLRISSFRRLVGIAKRKVLALSASSDKFVVADESDELVDDDDDEVSDDST